MSTDPRRLRLALVEGMARLDALGMNRNATGNMAVRAGDGFLITPTGIPTREMRPSDIVSMDFDGHREGRRKPSSEFRLHRDILSARPEIGAVLHSHATFCTTLAVHGRAIPAFHYMIAAAGGTDIRCAPYATFGTQALADVAVAALAGRKACLLAHHGVVVLGRDIDDAFAVAIEVEALAEQYWRALQIGEPPILSDAEMAVVIEKFATYGQRQTG